MADPNGAGETDDGFICLRYMSARCSRRRTINEQFMKKSNRIDLYEKMYFHELDRREKIASRMSTPLGALIGTLGVIAFLVNSDAQIDNGTARGAFWVLVSASVASLVIGGWHFRKAWFGQTDRHIATAAEIDAYHTQLEDKYREYPDSIDEYFDQFLLDTYRRSATTNALNNDQRSTALYYAGCWLTGAVVLSLLSTVPFYFGKDSAHDRQQAVAAATSAAAAGEAR